MAASRFSLILLCCCASNAGSFTLKAASRLPVHHLMSSRTVGPVAQLARQLSSEDDDNIEISAPMLQQRAADLEAEARELAETVGGSSATVQFMMTVSMRTRLVQLGYTEAEVDALTPATAASIIENASISSMQPETKDKTKRDRFEMQFTCNVCETRNTHSISRHAYTKGTVIVRCPSCSSAHLIADNLNWIEEDFKNIEEVMAKKGTPVTGFVRGGSAATAAAAAESLLPELEEEEEEAEERDVPARIDGISEDQALRIREAVQAHKKRNRQQ